MGDVVSEKTLQKVDEWLLVVLKIQPSEIEALDWGDYWMWFEVAQEQAKNQSRYE